MIFLKVFFGQARKDATLIYFIIFSLLFLFAILGSIFLTFFCIIPFFIWCIFTIIIGKKYYDFHIMMESSNEIVKKFAEKNNAPLINLTMAEMKQLKKKGIVKIDGVATPIILENIKGINND